MLDNNLLVIEMTAIGILGFWNFVVLGFWSFEILGFWHFITAL